MMAIMMAIILAIQTMIAMLTWMKKITGDNTNIHDNVDYVCVLVFPAISYVLVKSPWCTSKEEV